jgi:hypothetical protein
MRFARTSLGLIPDWQFSTDPAVNLKINPHVQYPAGVYQTTSQPLGPYYGGSEGRGEGLGYTTQRFANMKFPARGSLLGLSDLSSTQMTVGAIALLGVAAVAWNVLGKKKRRRR